MPNWCSNEVIISSNNKEELEAFISKINTHNAGVEDPDALSLCEVFYPTPKELLKEHAAPTNPVEFANALSGNRGVEYSDWYTWRLANWGTKWDVSNLTIDEGNGNYVLSYETAWSPINSFWDLIHEEYKSLRIDERYFEEGMNFIGQTVRTEDGDVIEEGGEIEKEDYIRAGAVMDEHGNIDWDTDQVYNLFDIFPII